VSTAVQEAVRLAEELQQPVILGKVKAHSGIPGNEIADEIAQATARGEQEACEEYPVPESNCRTELYWPCTEITEEDREGVERTRVIYADSLEGAVRTHTIDSLRLGGANTDTIYYQAMQNQMHRIDSQHLEFLANTTLITTTERIRRLQYLTGTLHSRKRAYWYGYCNTDICPNCKSSKDGGTHIMSACPAISTSYLSRHHALGRIIGKAVSHGNLGNSLEFCFTDIGSQDKWAAEDLLDKHHTLSEVPADLLDKKTLVECGSRPDMLLHGKGSKIL
jgi:hypothetical protein